MKTIEALKRYKEDSGTTGVAIALQLGFKSRLVNAWLNDENQPSGEYLVLCQEFLVEKGYTPEELREFCDCIKIIRRFFFKKRITLEDIRERFGLKNIKHTKTLLVHGKLSGKQKSVCIAYAAELLESSGLKKEAVNPSNDDVSSLLSSTVIALMGSIRQFLIGSTIAQRAQIRRENPALFDSSNVLSALCSEKAFERWSKENRI